MNWRNLVKVVDRLHRIAIYLCVRVSISIKTAYIQINVTHPFTMKLYIFGVDYSL